MKKILLIILVFLSGIATAQRNWFIDTAGNDVTGDGTIGNPYATSYVFFNTGLTPGPGDTVFYREGTYFNSDFASTAYVKSKNTSTIRIKGWHGSNGQNIVVRPYQNEHVIIKSNTSAAIYMNLSTYIRVEGFEIFGESDNILNDLGKDSVDALHWTFMLNGTMYYKVPPGSTDDEIDSLSNNGGIPASSGADRPALLETDGIMVGYCDHFEIVNNYVHHMPNEGIRSFFSDYQTITDNEVHDCSKLSSNGVHGLSVYNSNTIDNDDVQKIYIARNKVYNNHNFFISFNDGTSVTPHIDEGRGITIQRCTPAYGFNAGRILVENNVTWRNGNGGYIVNEGMNVTFRNNTSFHDQFTTYYHNGEEGCDCGTYFLGSINVESYNNIVILDTASQYIDGSRAFSGCCSAVSEMDIHDNIVNGGSPGWMSSAVTNSILLDPEFVDTVALDFSLKSTSPAINASVGPAPPVDFNNDLRDSLPDLGAIEFFGIICPSAIQATDHNLCSPAQITLDASTTTPGVSYSWTQNGLPLSTQPQLNVDTEGEYVITLSKPGCSDVTDTFNITSTLLDVTGDTICSAGNATLIVNETGGPYGWFADSTGGTELATGSSYSPTIASSTTYYVQDNNGAQYNFGKTSIDGTTWANGTGKYGNWGRKMELNVLTDIKLESFDLDVNTSTADLVIHIYNAGLTYDQTFNFNGLLQGFQTITLNEDLPADTYTLDLIGTQGGVTLQIDNNNNNSLAGIMDFSITQTTAHYGYFYNWVVSQGNYCDRAPVHAVIDPGNPNCVVSGTSLESNDFHFYPNPTSGQVQFNQTIGFEIVDVFGKSLISAHSNSADLSSLPSGIYILRSVYGERRVVRN